MLTVDYQLLGLRAGDRLLDLGCGAGRHAFEALRRGARVTAFDYDEAELKDVAAMATAMADAGDLPAAARSGTTRGDATKLPFPNDTFDRIIAAEVLEHIDDDFGAIRELVRVLKPGGTIAATVPAFLPERICWALTDEYHAPFVPGGHVRIYSATELRAKLKAAGFSVAGSHHAHALHSPYWWLKCAVGVSNDDHALVQRYRRFLEWDIVEQPRSTKLAERVLSPLLGKSLVLYSVKG